MHVSPEELPATFTSVAAALRRGGQQPAAGAQPVVPAGPAPGSGEPAAFAAHGLETWEFDVLSALRRLAPFGAREPGN